MLCTKELQVRHLLQRKQLPPPLLQQQQQPKLQDKSSMKMESQIDHMEEDHIAEDLQSMIIMMIITMMILNHHSVPVDQLPEILILMTMIVPGLINIFF